MLIRIYLFKMFKIIGWHLTIKTVPIITWVSCVNTFILALSDAFFEVYSICSPDQTEGHIG